VCSSDLVALLAVQSTPRRQLRIGRSNFVHQDQRSGTAAIGARMCLEHAFRVPRILRIRPARPRDLPPERAGDITAALATGTLMYLHGSLDSSVTARPECDRAIGSYPSSSITLPHCAR